MKVLLHSYILLIKKYFFSFEKKKILFFIHFLSCILTEDLCAKHVKYTSSIQNKNESTIDMSLKKQKERETSYDCYYRYKINIGTSYMNWFWKQSESFLVETKNLTSFHFLTWKPLDLPTKVLYCTNKFVLVFHLKKLDKMKSVENK